MKKIKSILLILLITSLLFILTGCGSNDPLTATKTDVDSTETTVVEFSNGKGTKVKTTIVYNNKESAQAMYTSATEMSTLDQNKNMLVQINGNIIIITNTMDSYAAHMGFNADKLGRDDIKTYFETSGYKVK